MILVDTSVWSLAFRRRRRHKDEPAEAQLLRRLILEDWPLALPGIVLQELLSGVRREAHFDRLKKTMSGFPLALATRDDHLEAAHVNNTCRKHGVTCSTVDALIAALAIRRGAFLFTNDGDFKHIAEHTELRLFADPA